MSTTMTIDLSITDGRKAIAITGYEYDRSIERIYGVCTHECTDDDVRAACGKTAPSISGPARVERATTGLGKNVQRFTVTAYSND